MSLILFIITTMPRASVSKSKRAKAAKAEHKPKETKTTETSRKTKAPKTSDENEARKTRIFRAYKPRTARVVPEPKFPPNIVDGLSGKSMLVYYPIMAKEGPRDIYEFDEKGNFICKFVPQNGDKRFAQIILDDKTWPRFAAIVPRLLEEFHIARVFILRSIAEFTRPSLTDLPPDARLKKDEDDDEDDGQMEFSPFQDFANSFTVKHKLPVVRKLDLFSEAIHDHWAIFNKAFSEFNATPNPSLECRCALHLSSQQLCEFGQFV